MPQDADRTSAQCVQVIDRLNSSLQEAVFKQTALRLPALLHAVPSHLRSVLLQCHVDAGVLDISDQFRHKDGGLLGELVTLIASMPPLRGLKLCSSSLHATDLPHLGHIVTAHAATLQSVSITRHMFAGSSVFARHRDIAVGHHLFEALEGCSVLTALDLASSHMSSSAAWNVMSSISGLERLQKLDISELMHPSESTYVAENFSGCLCLGCPA